VRLLLQLAQFVHLHLAVDVLLDLIGVATRSTEQVPERARHARELLRPEHDQRDYRDDHHLAEGQFKHLVAPRQDDAGRARYDGARHTAGYDDAPAALGRKKISHSSLVIRPAPIGARPCRA